VFLAKQKEMAEANSIRDGSSGGDVSKTSTEQRMKVLKRAAQLNENDHFHYNCEDYDDEDLLLAEPWVSVIGAADNDLSGLKAPCSGNAFPGDPESGVRPWLSARGVQRGSWRTRAPPNLPPRDDLELQWVYGYSARLTRGAVQYSREGRLTYPAGSMAVTLDRGPAGTAGPTAFQQRFLQAHDDTITAMDVHPASGLAATAALTDGENSVLVCVWQTATNSVVRRLYALPSPSPAHLRLVKEARFWGLSASPLDQGMSCASAVTFSACGNFLAVALVDSENSIIVYDWKMGLGVAGVGTGGLDESISGSQFRCRVPNSCCNKILNLAFSIHPEFVHATPPAAKKRLDLLALRKAGGPPSAVASTSGSSSSSADQLMLLNTQPLRIIAGGFGHFSVIDIASSQVATCVRGIFGPACVFETKVGQFPDVLAVTPVPRRIVSESAAEVATAGAGDGTGAGAGGNSENAAGEDTVAGAPEGGQPEEEGGEGGGGGGEKRIGSTVNVAPQQGDPPDEFLLALSNGYMAILRAGEEAVSRVVQLNQTEQLNCALTAIKLMPVYQAPPPRATKKRKKKENANTTIAPPQNTAQTAGAGAGVAASLAEPKSAEPIELEPIVVPARPDEWKKFRFVVAGAQGYLAILDAKVIYFSSFSSLFSFSSFLIFESAFMPTPTTPCRSHFTPLLVSHPEKMGYLQY
jgi:hypothetical protein